MLSPPVKIPAEEKETNAGTVPRTARIYTPKLARPDDAVDFVMEVRENNHS